VRRQPGEHNRPKGAPHVQRFRSLVGEYVGENAAVMMRAAMRIMMRAQAASV
jgi:hypothetical protein